MMDTAKFSGESLHHQILLYTSAFARARRVNIAGGAPHGRNGNNAPSNFDLGARIEEGASVIDWAQRGRCV